MFTLEQIEKAVKSKGYSWFSDPGNKGHSVNIVAVRNVVVGKKVTNVFDDWMTLSYKEDGIWKFQEWMCTTDPGTKAVKQFSNPNGVARLVPGQYKNSHIIRLHQGKYEAVCQQLPVKVWRDKNRDMTFDEVVLQEGVFGINIHRSNPTTESQYVENWSEGCLVFKRAKDFKEFMRVCKIAATKFGNSFTVTLIESIDIK